MGVTTKKKKKKVMYKIQCSTSGTQKVMFYSMKNFIGNQSIKTLALHDSTKYSQEPRRLISNEWLLHDYCH